MAAAFRAAEGTTFSNTASPVVNVPDGTTDGDLIIIAFGTDSVHAFTGVPSGWTQAGTTQDDATDSSTSVIYKIASSEGSDWTFTDLFDAAEFGVAGVVCYSGIDATTPLDVAVQQGAKVNNTAHTAGPITPTTNGSMIVACFGCDPPADQTGTADDSPAATERIDMANSTNGYIFIEDYLQETAAEISLDLTLATSDGAAWFMLALRPSAGGIALPIILQQMM